MNFWPREKISFFLKIRYLNIKSGRLWGWSMKKTLLGKIIYSGLCLGMDNFQWADGKQVMGKIIVCPECYGREMSKIVIGTKIIRCLCF